MATRQLSVADFEAYRKAWKEPTNEFYQEMYWEKKKLRQGFVYFRLFFTAEADEVATSGRHGKSGQNAQAEKVDDVYINDYRMYLVGLLSHEEYRQRTVRTVLNRLQKSNVDHSVQTIAKLNLDPSDTSLFRVIFENVVNERIEMTEKNSELVEATVEFAKELFQNRNAPGRLKSFIQYCLNRILRLVCTEGAESEKYFRACAVLLARMYRKLITLDVLVGTVIRVLKSQQPPERIKLLFVALILSLIGPERDKNGKTWDDGKETDFTKLSPLYSLMIDSLRRGVLRGQEKFQLDHALESRWDIRVDVKPPDTEDSEAADMDYWRNLFVDWKDTPQPRQVEQLFKDLTCERARAFDSLFFMLSDQRDGKDFTEFMCDVAKWIFDKGFLGWNMDAFMRHVAGLADQWELEVFMPAFAFIVQFGMSQSKTVDSMINDLRDVFLKQCKNKLSTALKLINWLIDKKLLIKVDPLTKLKAGKQFCDICEILFDNSDEQDKESIFRDCVWNIMGGIWDEDGEKMDQEILEQSVLYVGCMVWEVITGWVYQEERKEEDLRTAVQPLLALRTTPLVCRHSVEDQDLIRWFAEQTVADDFLELEQDVQLMITSLFQ